PPGFRELSIPLELLGDGDDIARLAVTGQRADGFENELVIGTIKVFELDDVRHVVPGGRVEKQAANDGLLRFDRVWRYRCVHGRDGFATRFSGAGHRSLTLPRRSKPPPERR